MSTQYSCQVCGTDMEEVEGLQVCEDCIILVTCDVEGETEDTFGNEHYWHCGKEATHFCCELMWCDDHFSDHHWDQHEEFPDNNIIQFPSVEKFVATYTEGFDK